MHEKRRPAVGYHAEVTRTTLPSGEKCRVFEAVSPRAETGVIKFGDDWAGIWIRGDNAFGYARMIEDALTRSPEIEGLDRAWLEELQQLLDSSNEFAGVEAPPTRHK